MNTKIGEMEQEGAKAEAFFKTHLSDHLIFRRASGMVVGKSGPDSFLESLINKPSPFTSRVSEDISVALLNDRALVTLIVVGTKADNSVWRYRNIRLFCRSGGDWMLELWYNYQMTSL